MKTCPALHQAVALLLLMISAIVQADSTTATGCPAGNDTTSLLARYRSSVACWPAFDVDASVRSNVRELAPLPVPPSLTRPEEVALGMQLFFDPRLSGSGQIACASCHDPDLAWADGRQLAIGHSRQRGRRNSPTILNAQRLTEIFWDGRVRTLEQQAVMAIVNPIEMNADLSKVIARLQGIPGYRESFKTVYGSNDITADTMAQAISSFVRSINSKPSAFDDFMRGKKTSALNDAAIRGLHLFRTKAGCMNCHHGPWLTDNSYHNLGLHLRDRPLEDLGRYNFTGKTEDAGKFRTPSLRDAALTTPYMHNGLIPTLQHVIMFYNQGGGEVRSAAKNQEDALFPLTTSLLKPLNLSSNEMDDLEAFLRSLATRQRRTRHPELPPDMSTP